MKKTTKKVELAQCDEHGAWDLIGDYHTVESAQRAAVKNGPGKYGISEEPDSSYYEIEFVVDDDNPDGYVRSQAGTSPFGEWI